MGMNRNEIEKFEVCEEITSFYKAVDLLESDVNLFGLFESSKPQNLTYIQTRAKRLNDFIQLIREQMNSKEIKHAIRNRVKNCESNFKTCRRLINGCFNTWGKLLVLRIDFGFKVPQEILNPHNRINDLKNPFHSLDNLMILKKQMERFLNNRRHHKSLSKIKSYILKFEHGIKKGFHVHAIFILNGNKHNKDGFFAKEFTEYWKKLTDGNGCTYNCHMAKQRYKRIGIGMTHHTDTEKRAVIESCLQYLCKQDQFFMFSSLKGAKTMQMSQLPKRRSNAGRPRKEMSLDNSVILKNTNVGKKHVN